MIEIIIFLGFVLGLLTIPIFSNYYANRSRKKYLNNLYFNNHENVPFDRELFNTTSSEGYGFIDTITFKDLNLDALFSEIDHTISVNGKVGLYNHLRNLNNSNFTQIEQLIKTMEDPSSREELMMPFFDIGQETIEIHEMASRDLQKSQSPLIRFVGFLRILAFLAPFTFLISIPLAIVIVGIVSLINFIIHELIMKSIGKNMRVTTYNINVIKTGRKLSKLTKYDNLINLDSLNDALSPFKSLTFLYGFAQPHFGNVNDTGVSGFAHALSAYFLTTPYAYTKITKTLNTNFNKLNQLKSILQMVEVGFSISCYRNQLTEWNHPILSENNFIKVQGMNHPLLGEKGVKNTHIYSQYNLITGSNASGKSTFVRSLAVNAILAQTINTVCAQYFEIPRCHVATAMALIDNIESGDSYFVTETKSIKRIIDMINDSKLTLVCIDEVLKGTNTSERIAAAASILNYLHSKNCFVFAATHDLELTNLLKDKYDNYHFSEIITDSGIFFDYLIKEGASNTTNALKLLEFYEYDESITSFARDMIDIYKKTGSWSMPQ